MAMNYEIDRHIQAAQEAGNTDVIPFLENMKGTLDVLARNGIFHELPREGQMSLPIPMELDAPSTPLSGPEIYLSEKGTLGKFSDEARRSLILAQEESRKFNHNYVGTEHILLGLLAEEGKAAEIFSGVGIEINRVRSAVEFIIGRGERDVEGPIGLTPRAEKVLKISLDSLRIQGKSKVDSCDLLYGLAKEGEGIAAGVLESLGVYPERILEEIRRVSS